jgi:hypothetical protein
MSSTHDSSRLNQNIMYVQACMKLAHASVRVRIYSRRYLSAQWCVQINMCSIWLGMQRGLYIFTL